MKQYRVSICVILLFLIATFILILGRVYSESKDFYRKGTESFLKDDLYMAALYFGRSAKWYFPGNPYVRRSIKGLLDTANKAEEIGETEFALKACYTLRGSLYGTKGLFMPHKEWLEPCNQKIADLTVIRNPYVKREKVLQGLYKKVGPRVGWALLVVLGFWGWIGTTIGFIYFSFDSSGAMAGKKAALWGGLVLGLFLLWIFSMMRA